MQHSEIHYLAYGSNLHPLRLKERIPSAQMVGITPLHKHKLLFHKKSHDGSGKCDLVETRDNADIAHGAIYQLKREDKAALDRYEGRGKGYKVKHVTIQMAGRDYRCFVYLAQPGYIKSELHPYHWYKELVILGAEFLKFPDTYISTIRNFTSVRDENSERIQQNEALINRIQRYQL